MKTFNIKYIAAAVISLCTIRKIDVEKMAQAIDATLTDCFKASAVIFAGFQKVKGEKGELNALQQGVARLPQGTIRTVCQYLMECNGDARRTAKRNGTVVYSDFTPEVRDWFMQFSTETTVADDAVKADKAAKAKAKAEAKAALEATRKQVEAAKAAKTGTVLA